MTTFWQGLALFGKVFIAFGNFRGICLVFVPTLAKSFAIGHIFIDVNNQILNKNRFGESKRETRESVLSSPKMFSAQRQKSFCQKIRCIKVISFAQGTGLLFPSEKFELAPFVQIVRTIFASFMVSIRSPVHHS